MSTQKALVAELRRAPQGASLDELAARLGITRTAVRQHIATLERDGLVKRGALARTGGRPVQRYLLSREGAESLPKQYPWFAQLMLAGLAEQHGSEELQRFLRTLGVRIGLGVANDFGGLARTERIERTAEVMTTLHYDAKVKLGHGLPVIEAHNCVYHHLAEKHPEVCQFDLAFLEAATGCHVEQTECMVRGGHVCRFELSK